MDDQSAKRNRIIKENQTRNNRMVIKDYRLKSLDSKPAIKQYQAEVRKVAATKHLTLVKEEEKNA